MASATARSLCVPLAIVGVVAVACLARTGKPRNRGGVVRVRGAGSGAASSAQVSPKSSKDELVCCDSSDEEKAERRAQWVRLPVAPRAAVGGLVRPGIPVS